MRQVEPTIAALKEQLATLRKGTPPSNPPESTAPDGAYDYAAGHLAIAIAFVIDKHHRSRRRRVQQQRRTAQGAAGATETGLLRR